jgi:transcriptional regulator with XRE-family HTH domain
MYRRGGEHLSNKIKAIRVQKGITQKKLADAVGVSSPYIHDLENNNRGARNETLDKIAAALGVTVSELLGEEKAG